MKKISLIYNGSNGKQNIECAKKVLEALSDKFGHEFLFTTPISTEDKSCFDLCLSSDSVLASVSEPFDLEKNNSFKRAIIDLKRNLKLYADVAKFTFPQQQNTEILVVKDIAGGIYTGSHGTRHGKFGRESFDTECYSEIEIERVARVAFELAEQRRGILTSVDKADKLESSRLWRYAVFEVAQDYPTVRVEDMLLEEAISTIIKNPNHFDVILSSNLFGDALDSVLGGLTDESVIPSASVNDTLLGLYQPSIERYNTPHSALSSPIAILFSACMMLSYSFGMATEAKQLERAIKMALQKNIDLYSPSLADIIISYL